MFSVLSAVSGVKIKIPELHESKYKIHNMSPINEHKATNLILSFFLLSDYIVVISCVILVGLFSLQHHGTHRVAFMFAPIVTAWLLCISSIGIYNIIKWNPHVVRALSPAYMLKFLKSTGVEGWVSLGGVVLSITGSSDFP